MRGYRAHYSPATMEIIDRYALAMERRNLQPSTINARRYEIGRWIEHAGASWRDAEPEQLEQFLDGRPLAARARYTALSHLHRFYLWAIRQHLVDDDPTVFIERPRLPHRLPRPARLGDVELAILGARWDIGTAMLLMVDAGLRCCEVARLDWGDVDLERGTMMVRGKGDRDRLLAFTDLLAARLSASDQTTGPVFGRHVTAARMSQLVNAYMRRAGLPYTAHQLRHTFATRMYDELDGSILKLAKLMGHESVLNTQIYTKIDAKAAADAMRGLGRAA
jgi:integrase/recombinase XerD